MKAPAWSRTSSRPPAWLGPCLAVVAVLAATRLLGPVAPARVLALAAAASLLLLGLVRYDLWFTGFLLYLLFETVAAPFLPPPLPLLSKDIAYLAVVGLGLWIAAVGARRVRHPRAAPGTAALLLFLLLTLWLVLRGPSLYLGALGFRTLAYFCFVAVLMPLAYGHRGARRLSLALLATGLTVVALVGDYEFFHWRQVRLALQLEEQRWTMGTLKASSTVGSPGALGAVMGLGLLFLLSRALAGGLRRRAWLLGGVLGVVWFSSLALSLSRISQLAFVAAALVLVMLRGPRWVLPGLVLLALAGAVANRATDGFLVGNLLATVGRGEHLDAIQSTQDRLDILRETLSHRVPERPWLGWGLGASGAPTRGASDVAPFGYLFLDNLYLKMLFDGGVLLLGAYVVLLGGLVAGAWRVARRLGGADAVWVWAGGGGLLFLALVGMASTVHEMPVVNAGFWWCAGWVLWGAARLRPTPARAAGTAGAHGAAARGRIRGPLPPAAGTVPSG